MDAPVIIFPNLGITIQSLPNGFNIGNFHIAFYGICIAIGMVLAVWISMQRAKRINQYADHYFDIGIISLIAAIVGARIYYVVFSWDMYKDNFWNVFNIRQGGLAIYGGLIGAFLAAFFVCRYKKISFIRGLDIAAPTIALGQAIGRWGNFFNKEAYGCYTDSLFAMQILKSEANGGTQQDVLDHIVNVNGADYIQVHPTFLYESAWCLLLFIIIMLCSKLQQYKGEIFLWYIGGYALERSFVEGLRTDQLQVGGIAVSQVLSIALLAGSFALLLINRIRIWTGAWKPDFHYVLEDGEPGTKAHFEARRNKKEKAMKEKWKVAVLESAEKEKAEAKSSETVETDEDAANAEIREESEAAAEAQDEAQ